jgi:tripartite-type tricarboxylate transporter receptor subunit TctC
VRGYEANTWQMMVGPAHMPPRMVAKLNGALSDFMGTAEARQHFIALGMQPLTSTPEQAHEYIRVEAARWTQIIRGIGLSVD